MADPHPFQPKTKRFPMDRQSDFCRDQRKRRKPLKQRAVGQFPAYPGETGAEDTLGALAGVDADRDAFRRRGQPKIVD